MELQFNHGLENSKRKDIVALKLSVVYQLQTSYYQATRQKPSIRPRDEGLKIPPRSPRPPLSGDGSRWHHPRFVVLASGQVARSERPRELASEESPNNAICDATHLKRIVVPIITGDGGVFGFAVGAWFENVFVKTGSVVFAVLGCIASLFLSATRAWCHGQSMETLKTLGMDIVVRISSTVGPVLAVWLFTKVGKPRKGP